MNKYNILDFSIFEKGAILYFIGTSDVIYEIEFVNAKDDKIQLNIDSKKHSFNLNLLKDKIFESKVNAILYLYYTKNKNRSILEKYKDDLKNYPELFI